MPATLSDKEILTTAECGEICGREIIFEELIAIYGGKLLKPLRTMPNGAQTWDRKVVRAAISLAQSEGSLNDRPRVEKALQKLRETRRILRDLEAGS